MALKLPTKYKNNALHIWCNQCKKVVTSSPCAHSAHQVYQSRIYNPATRRQDIIKSWPGKDIHRIFQQHLAFKTDQKSIAVASSAQQIPKSSTTIITILSAAQAYIDYIQDIGVPVHKRKALSPGYIRDQTYIIKQFLKLVKSKGMSPGSHLITDLSDIHAGWWHSYVSATGLGDYSYNAYINGVRYMVNHTIGTYHIQMVNPFVGIKRKAVTVDPEIISTAEFQQLLDSINIENGKGTKGANHETVNYYRPWLADFFTASLLIGDRLDGMVLLTWAEVQDNVIAIPNHKVNRIKNTAQYISYTPITTDLAQMLLRLSSGGSQTDYLLVPEWSNRNTLKSFISKAFTHYWKVTGINKKVSFKNLRKTYITRIYELLGDKAQGIKHTKDSKVLGHYLNQQQIVSVLNDQRLFDLE